MSTLKLMVKYFKFIMILLFIYLPHVILLKIKIQKIVNTKMFQEIADILKGYK